MKFNKTTTTTVHSPSSFTASDFFELDDIQSHRDQDCGLGPGEERIDTEKKHHDQLEYDGERDKSNPKNWPFAARVYATFVPALCTLLVSFSASVYVAGLLQIQMEFNVSETVAMLGLSLYVIGLGLGPMIGAPISETKGRIPVYWISMLLFAAFTFGTAKANSITTLLICRFLAGTFGSPALAVGGGTVSEVWDLRESAGTAGTAFLMMAFLGPALGPLVGGIVAQHKGWRWLMWASLMFNGICLFSLIFARETHKKTILMRRAKTRGIEIRRTMTPREGLKQLLVIILARPVKMMFTEWIVGFTAIYNAFLFALLFLFFEAIPYVMNTVYNFNLERIGFSFISMAIGMLAAGGTFLVFDLFCYQPLRRRADFYKRQLPPEHRLYASMLGSVLIPMGVFWFSWLATPGLHWTVPLIGVVMIAWGMVAINLSLIAYMFDVYDELICASALAANSMARYVLGAVFPLFALHMYRGLGRQWAGSLLGCIAVALMPIPWLLWHYGKRIRTKSSFIGGSTLILTTTTTTNSSSKQETPKPTARPASLALKNPTPFTVIGRPYAVSTPSRPPRTD